MSLQNVGYKLRFIASEWARIEHELTRERGLWGPEVPSPLDKWMLDCVEGPSRMRKRLCRNAAFYCNYPFDPAMKSAVSCSVSAYHLCTPSCTCTSKSKGLKTRVS